MIAALFLLATGVSGPQVVYPIAPARGNQLTLTVGKTGLLAGKQHLLLFPKMHGQISFDRNLPQQSAVQVTVETNSLAVQDDWVKDKDRARIREYALGTEMLNAARQPAITFQSQEIARDASDHYRVSGLLTIAGKTRPATINATVRELKDRLVIVGSAMLRLSDYHLRRPTAALGSIGTRDEMTLTIELVTATHTSR